MAFAIYGLAVVFAPAIGPTLGGWITDNYSWRWIFFINIPVGILSLLLSYRLVHDSPEAKTQHSEVWKNGLRIDYIGFGLVALGLGCLQVLLDKGQEDDWFGSNFICVIRRPGDSGDYCGVHLGIVRRQYPGGRSSTAGQAELFVLQHSDVLRGVYSELHNGDAAAVCAADHGVQCDQRRVDSDGRRIRADVHDADRGKFAASSCNPNI